MSLQKAKPTSAGRRFVVQVKTEGLHKGKPYGPPIDKGVELAVAEINQAGGVFGKKIAVLSCDSGTDAEVAGPGFLNLRLSDDFWRARLRDVLAANLK